MVTMNSCAKVCLLYDRLGEAHLALACADSALELLEWLRAKGVWTAAEVYGAEALWRTTLAAPVPLPPGQVPGSRCLSQWPGVWAHPRWGSDM